MLFVIALVVTVISSKYALGDAIGGVGAALGYFFFGTAAYASYNVLHQQEKDLQADIRARMTPADKNSMDDRSRLIELLCLNSFVCELLVVCESVK